MTEFEQVIEHFGNQSKLALALGVTRQAVALWKIEGSIPPGNAVQIERLTEGKFKAIDLVAKKGE